MIRKKLCYLLLTAAFLTACGGPRSGGAAAPPSDDAKPAYFLPMLPPADLDAAGQQAYLREHYWDRLDFADTLFLRRADSLQMLDAFVGYLRIIGPMDGEAMRGLMARAAQSKPMLTYFYTMAEKVLNDPNSPFRSDELLIPVLETVIASPSFDEYEKMAPAYDLQLASQNRIGRPANDFRFTLASGARQSLYGIKAEYTLLFLHNPGCPMCREIMQELTASPMLTELIERGALRVLALYPDEDLGEWRRHFDEIPASWINAYDAGCTIEKGRLYSLRAIPALYLLDSQKQVLLKDVTEVAQVEELIDRRG